MKYSWRISEKSPRSLLKFGVHCPLVGNYTGNLRSQWEGEGVMWRNLWKAFAASVSGGGLGDSFEEGLMVRKKSWAWGWRGLRRLKLRGTHLHVSFSYEDLQRARDAASLIPPTSHANFPLD